MKVGKMHQRLAYLAAAASAVSVIMAIISRFAGAQIVITQTSYMSFAGVAVLFAIYFLVQGVISSGKS